MSQDLPPVTVPGSELRFLESAHTGAHYALRIGLPLGYEDSDGAYPVVYTSPGFPDFYLLWPVANLMTVSDELQPVIVVSIGYQTDDPDEVLKGRIRDHMPGPAEKMDGAIKEFLEVDTLESGHADRFLRFIHTELQPFINATYRTRPAETAFAGFSSAGLFGLYTLFHHPQTFAGYILGSPPVFRAERAILADEQAYAETHNDLPAQLFLGVGGLEESDDPFTVIGPEHHFVSNLEALAATLRERDYPSLEMTLQRFPDETHLSVPPALYSRGLRMLFG